MQHDGTPSSSIAAARVAAPSVALAGLIAVLVCGTAGADASAGAGARVIGYAVAIARACPGWRVVEQARLADAGLLERSEDWTRLAPGGAVHDGFWAGMADAEADLAADRDLCRDPFKRADREPDLLRQALERDARASGNGEGEDTFIGSARQEADGTIVLDLVSSERGTVAEDRVRYAPSGPNYAAVAAHVGPIPAGSEVLVRPFPDMDADPRR